MREKRQKQANSRHRHPKMKKETLKDRYEERDTHKETGRQTVKILDTFFSVTVNSSCQ